MFCIFTKLSKMKQLKYTCNQLLQREVSKSSAFSAFDTRITKKKTVQDSAKLTLLGSLLNRKNLENDEWKKFRTSLLKADRSINTLNVDATVMNFFLSNRELQMAKSYINYITAIGVSPNIATLGNLLKLFYLSYKDTVVPPSEQGIISSWCNDMSKIKNLDASSCENLIHGLCLTNDWQTSLKFLEMIKITCKPSVSTYSVIIETAFKSDDPEIALELLDKMLKDSRLPKCAVYISWIDHCIRIYEHNNLLVNIEKMLKLIGNNDIHITKIVADKLISAFKTLNWTGEYTKIDPNGYCLSCKQNLTPITFSNEEFFALRENFINKVLVRGNAFVRTTPQELNSYMDFIKRKAPFNIVVDGLNVAHSGGANSKKLTDLAIIVSAVVKHFAESGKKVLVLGRKHMSKWPGKAMADIKSNAEIFLTENLSYDDPYLIYAALYSGPDTYIVSRDLMRSHAFLLEDRNLKMSFKKWQQKQQYQLLSFRNNKVTFKEPLKFLPTAHNSHKGWHIPYVEEYDPNPSQTINAPLNWLCLCKTSV